MDGGDEADGVAVRVGEKVMRSASDRQFFASV